MPPEWLEVDVTGGRLTVASWPGDGPTILALHGITANALCWTAVAERLAGRATLLAPDLRGRAGSRDLPPPYGIASHVDDMVALTDQLSDGEVVGLGHSLGAFVLANLGAAHPSRVQRAVLVDGGYTLPAPVEADLDAVLHAVIGPAMERLTMTFPSREAYADFWRAHPALREHWSSYVEDYLQRDLVGEAPWLRSSCRLEAIRADGRDTLVDPRTRDAVLRLNVPALLLWAERGMLNQYPGLYDEQRLVDLWRAAPAIRTLAVPAVNHYTVLFEDPGVELIARAALDAAGRQSG